MKNLTLIALGLGLIASYVLFFDDISELKQRYFKIVGALSAVGFPVFLLFSGWLKKRQDQTSTINKSKDEVEKDRELFASIGSADDGKDNSWPVGYSGFNADKSTDEYIKRFIDQDHDPSKSDEKSDN